MTLVLTTLLALMAGYAGTGAAVTALYRRAHRAQPLRYFKRATWKRGILFWPKVAVFALQVRFHGVTADACTAHCAVCPFNEPPSPR